MAMTPREWVHTALSRMEPDRVPYCELGVDRSLAQRLMGWGAPETQASNLEANVYTVEEAKALARHLGLDNISYVLRAPVYARKEAGRDGRLFYGEGLIRTEADLHRLQLPDPHDDALYAGAEAFLRQKGEYSTWFVTRIGIFPTMLSLGTENFCLALYDAGAAQRFEPTHMRHHHLTRVAVGRSLTLRDRQMMIGAVHAIDNQRGDIPVGHAYVG